MKKGQKIGIAIGALIIGVGGIVGGYYIGENVTDKQIEKSHDKGYQEGYDFANQEWLENKIIYEKTLAENKATMASQKAELDGAKDQVKLLTESKATLMVERDTMKTERDNWKTKYDALQETTSALQNEVSALKASAVTDKAEIESLKASGQADQAELERRANLLEQKETLIASYEQTISQNLQNMTEINNKIVQMSNQIIQMSNAVQTTNATITALNTTIAQLEKSVNYYEQFIAQLENGEQVVVTLKFDNSVYNIQIIEKGTSPHLPTPTSTRYVQFNYWMKDGERVDESVTINSNTIFVANVTYKFDVTYMNGDTQFGETQLVVKDGHATLPTETPTKEGYTFEGYTLDGVNLVDPTTIAITQNTTFIAKFSKLCEVKFVSEDATINTQTVKAGAFAEDVTMESTTKKIFNGWKLNGVLVDVETTPINGAVTFVADWTYKYDVKFMLDADTQLGDTQIILKGNKPTFPTEPTKEGYQFKGWSTDGVNVIEDTSALTINADTTISACWSKICTVSFTGALPSNATTKENLKNKTILEGQTFDLSTIGKVHKSQLYDGATNDPIDYADGLYDVYYTFKGWSIDGGKTVCANQVVIEGDTQFTAVFEFDFEGSWSGTYNGHDVTLDINHNNVLYSSYYNSTSSSVVTKIAALSIMNYETSDKIYVNLGSKFYCRIENGKLVLSSEVGGDATCTLTRTGDAVIKTYEYKNFTRKAISSKNNREYTVSFNNGKVVADTDDYDYFIVYDYAGSILVENHYVHRADGFVVDSTFELTEEHLVMKGVTYTFINE